MESSLIKSKALTSEKRYEELLSVIMKNNALISKYRFAQELYDELVDCVIIKN